MLRVLAIGAAVLIAGPGTSAAEPDREAVGRLFATDVLPLFRAKCFACHGDDAGDLHGEFDMRSREALLAGGESGEAAIVPGDAAGSPLVRAIEWDGLEMPPKENDRLAAGQIAVVRAWVDGGAPWPDEATIERLRSDAEAAGVVRVTTSGGLSEDWTNRRYDPADLWAYRPVERPSVPGAGGRHGNAVDAFLGAKLAEAGLTAAEPADRLTLIRRVTFDLTGLPPRPVEVEAFLADESPDAYERLVDRLLASPHYGEQAARLWLDVTRYADSAGFSNDFERPHAWRYRDYVVRSFNADKPYDRFVTEQVAGDELDADDPEMLVAVGFLRMGPWEHTGMSVAAVTRQQYLDDVTNAVGETFLAQGMSCCRCHDHKFDPVPTRDYYRLQAVFAPVQFADRDAAFLAEENTAGLEEGRGRVETLSRDTADALRLVHAPDATPQQREEAPLALKKLYEKRKQAFDRDAQRFKPLAMSVYSGPPIERRSNNPYHPLPKPMARKGEPQEVFVLTGGSLESPAEKVGPGVLSAVEGLRNADLGLRIDQVATADDDDGSIRNSKSEIPNSLHGRRLALARWIASPENPLTARVMVNRIWQQHFGAGLAGNPNNFGKMGRKPSHPELLDWLAGEFVGQGWSVKALHRLIVMSDAYRRSGTPVDPEAADRIDPENKLLSWFPPRRLSAEEIRDAALAASGELNDAIGGFSARPEINREVAAQPRHVMGSVSPAYQPSRTPAERNRRTLYCLKIRTLRDPTLEVLDQPTPDLSCERRSQSTVAPQAFALFNGQASHDRALAAALRLESEAASEERIGAAFRLFFGRDATEDERRLASQQVARAAARYEGRRVEREPLPTRIERAMVEEQTGTEIRWSERLDVYEDYVPDAKPWDVGPGTRALADLCLVLLNSNEFLYVY